MPYYELLLLPWPLYLKLSVSKHAMFLVRCLVLWVCAILASGGWFPSFTFVACIFSRSVAISNLEVAFVWKQRASLGDSGLADWMMLQKGLMGGFNFDMSVLFRLLEVQLCMSWPVARQWSWGASPKLFTMLQFQLAFVGLVGFLFPFFWVKFHILVTIKKERSLWQIWRLLFYGNK